MIIFVFLKDYSGKFVKDKLERNNNGKNHWKTTVIVQIIAGRSEPEQKHTKEMKLKVLITNRQLEGRTTELGEEWRKEGIDTTTFVAWKTDHQTTKYFLKKQKQGEFRGKIEFSFRHAEFAEPCDLVRVPLTVES